MRRLTVLLVILALVGCVPGYSLTPLTASSAGITYEYTYSVGSEYPAAVKQAETHCQQFGKHARPVGQPVRLGVDRATATFECVAP